MLKAVNVHKKHFYDVTPYDSILVENQTCVVEKCKGTYPCIDYMHPKPKPMDSTHIQNSIPEGAKR